MRLNKILYLGAFVLTIAGGSCVKQKFETPALAEFVAAPTSYKGTYYIADDPNSIFKVPVGITTTSGKDRVINFSVSSPSGATEGQQYTIGATSITIPAGKVVDSIPVKGIFAGFPAGKKDTLIITITGGDAGVFKGAEKYTLVMQKFCPVLSLTDFEGDYTNTFDDDSYGPYTTQVVAGAITGTTGTIIIKNLYDAGFADLPVTLNWTDNNNFTLTFTAQNTGVDASVVFGASYAGLPLWIYPTNTAGTFSACENTFTVRYQVGIPNVGKGDEEYTVLSR
jgi:hypothetical protein